MLKLVGEIILRSAYRILADSEGNYRVTHQDCHGAEYCQAVAVKVARYVQRKCQGETVTVAEARSVLESAPKELEVPYDYGYKLGFYAQSVLLVLVATRQAEYSKIGQRFDFTVLKPKATVKTRRAKKGQVGRTKQPR